MEMWYLSLSQQSEEETHLLSGFQLIPPLLHQLVVLLVQMLQPLRLVLHQQVAFLILGHKTRVCYFNVFILMSLLSSLERKTKSSHLQLLQLSDVTLTLTDHLPHLVLMFLLLMQPLRLLPLVLLLRKLHQHKESEILPLQLYT